MTPLEWLMLFTAHEGPDSPAPSNLDPVKIQKGLFLLAQVAELPAQSAYEYVPDDYGPLSAEIYQDLRTLVSVGVLKAKPVEGKRWSMYAPTELGKQLAAGLAQHPAAKEHLAEMEVIRGMVSHLSFGEILSATYAAYPEYAIATVAPERLPEASGGTQGRLTTLFTPRELRIQAMALRSEREIARGEFVTGEEFFKRLNDL